MLLRENAAVDLSDHEGFTAFHWASAVGNDDICVFLATETDIDVERKKYVHSHPIHCFIPVRRSISPAPFFTLNSVS